MGRRPKTIREANATNTCAFAAVRRHAASQSAFVFSALLLLLCSPIVRAQAGQPGVITSLVGPQALNDPSVSGASLIQPTGVAFDSAGSIYTADPFNCVVWKTQAGTTSVFAGILPGTLDAPCTGGTATTVPTTTPLAYPVALAQCNGTVFIAAEGIDPVVPGESGSTEVGGTVDEVDTNGNLSTLPLPLPPSGVGLHPVAIACDASGNVYVSSYFYPAGGGGIVGNVNEFLLTSSGWTTSTFATPPAGDVYPAIAFNPTTQDLDGILATGALGGWVGSPNLLAGMIWDITKSSSGLASNNNFTNASALAIDPNGNFYVAQATSNQVPSTYVDFVQASTGTTTAIAGTGSTIFNGSGILSTTANLDGVTELALDSTNNDIYLADSINDVVQRIHSLVPGPSKLTVLPTGVPQSSSATYGSMQGALNPATGDFYYVTGANTINVINTNIVCPSCSRIVAAIPVGANSGGSTSTLTMAVDSTRNRVYVSNTFDGNLYAIDGSTYKVTGSANLGNPNASLLAVDTGTNEIYAGGPNATSVSALGGGLAPNGSELTLIGNYGYPVNSLSVNSPSADAPTHVLYAVADSGAGAGVTGEAFITMTPDPSTGALAVSAVAFPLQFAETVGATPGFIANSIAADPVSGSLFASGAASTDSFIEYYIYDFDQFTTPLTPYIQSLDYGWPPITTSLDIPNRVLYTTDFDGNVSDPSSHAEMVYRIDGEAAGATYPGSTAIPVFGSGTPTSPHVYDAEPDTSSYQAWISASDSSGGFVSLWDAGSQKVTASTIPSPSLGGGHLFVNPGAQDAYLLDHVNGQLWLINTPSWTTTPPPTLSQAANLQSVTISATGSGDSVYYTLDGTAPGLGSTACSPLPCMVAVTTGQYTTINAIEVSATSGAASNVVREVFTAPAPTTLGLGLSPANPTTGATLILTATIAPASGVSTVTGTVSFAATPPNLSTPVTLLSCSPVSVVNNSGTWQAACPFVEAAPGSYTFTAGYSGDPLNQPSMSNPYPAIVNAGTTPVLGSVAGVSNVLAINSNYPPAVATNTALNSYNAVLNSDSSVELLLGSELTGLSCPAFPGMSGASGAVYLDYANYRIYVVMLKGVSLYAAFESIDPTTGACTQGPPLNLSPTAPLANVQMSVDPVQGNMYVMNYYGAFSDKLYILSTASWPSSPPTPLALDYSVQYGPIVIDPSNHFVYINDLGGSGCVTVGTCGSPGFWVYEPNATPPLQHVFNYTSSSGTTPYYVGTLLTNGAGKLVLVNENPLAPAYFSFPITILDTTQSGFSFSSPGAALSTISEAPSPAPQYNAIGGADIASNVVYAFGFNSNDLSAPGLLLEYNLASLQETGFSNSTVMAMPSRGSSEPWGRMNYNPESTELALSAGANSSGALGITSQLCVLSGTTPFAPLSLTQVAPSAANPSSSPAYPVVNSTSGYAYAIDSGGIDFVAPPPVCPSTSVQVSPSSLPAAAAGSTYLHTLTASGGSGPPYTFSVTSFSGPSGPTTLSDVHLALLPNGPAAATISGTPTATGTFTLTVQVTDSSQKNTATATYMLIINPALAIIPTNLTLPAGIVGGSYPQTTFGATGGDNSGTPPYIWSITGLPAGLTPSTTGVVSGTPTTSTGSPFTVTVTVTDSSGNTASQTYSLTIYPQLAITPTALPPGTVGVAYPQTTLSGVGGSGPTYTFTVASGTALSAVGLTLSAAGLISGTPNATETDALFTVQVEDSVGDLTQQGYALTIGAAVSTPAQVMDNEFITVSDTETFPDVVDSEPITVTDTVSVTVSSPAIMTLTASPNGIAVNGAVILRATVTTTGGTPTGEVTFSFNGAALPNCATVAVNPGSGMAICPTNSLTAGSDLITATYSGDSSFTAAPATALVAVTPFAAMLNLSPAPSSTTNFNTPVTFTAALAGNGISFAPIAPSGAVNFTSNDSTIAGCGAVAIDRTTGKATCTTSSLAAGSDLIVANYFGDPNFVVANPGSVVQTVSEPAILALSALPSNSTRINTLVTFTAALTGAGISFALTPPTGVVKFTANGNTIVGCGAMLISPTTGMASCATASLPEGSDLITATYSGDPKIIVANPAIATQAVSPFVAMLSLSAAPSSSTNLGAPVTFTAALTGSGIDFAPFAPSGTVDFMVNGVTITGCSAVLVSPVGIATCPTSSLAAGSDLIVATYSGDPNFVATAVTAIQTVTAPALMITANPGALIIPQGQTGQTTITFTPVGGYNGTLVLSCSGLPANTLCLFTLNGAPVNSVVLTGNNQLINVVLTFETDVNGQQARMGSTPKPLWRAAILTAIAFWCPGSLLGLIALRRKRKLFSKNPRAFGLCLFALLIGTLASLAGCVSGGGFGAYVTPVGSSTVTVVVTPSSGSAQTLNIGVTITH